MEWELGCGLCGHSCAVYPGSHYAVEDIIRRMMERQKGMRIPSELLPVCPHCGKPLTMNLRSDHRFVEDEGWHREEERYNICNPYAFFVLPTSMRLWRRISVSTLYPEIKKRKMEIILDD